ncbi:hypothetical protein NQ314_009695 [Rhamnusium bicolor]|uniref:Uncharacterized protein n=1 Tax=Rhamnusium bicolor TaxID=1586634 RepID=A0AAV8XXJ1_9CUCU|nr:hypothetical protein NQ314_009695 [Rhamnusium bicolor]
MLVIIGGLFLVANLILLVILYFKCYKNKKNNSPKLEEAEEITEEEKQKNDEEAFLVNGCNIVRMINKSSKSDDTYAAVKSSSTSKSKLSRQMSSSTIDAHTKVRDWITQEIVYKYSPRFLRRPKHSHHTKIKIPAQEEASSQNETEKYSSLGRSPTRPVSPSDEPTFKPTPMKTSTITRPKTAKPAKVSVAIDATPTGRGNSVLMQQPIKMTKSLDCPDLKPDTEIPLRRSITLEDFSPRVVDNKKELRKSTTSINLKYSEVQPTIIKIDHGYSKSEPVQDLNYTHMRKLKTFDPNSDVNVTSRDDKEQLPMPLTPEESLMTIKRRKFPKVLPDHPGREALIQKRRSMPAHSLFLPIPESSSFSQPNSPTNKSFTKLPPTPPPRTTTLSKQSSTPLAVCVSEPMLAEEPFSPEPEVICNNLYVGPLIPKNRNWSKGEELNTQPIYESLRNLKQGENKSVKPKTIVTANPNAPIKRADPRIVVRPTITRKLSDDKHNKHIPRVVVPDNQPQLYQNVKPELTANPNLDEKENKDEGIDSASTTDSLNVPNLKNVKAIKSQIPTLVKTSGSSLNKESSSSESTPSEESDTGTVVKRV